jgi:copper homeostasis protein (lipoprotein)
MKQYLLAVTMATLALAACKREAEPAPALEPAVVAPVETNDPAAATGAIEVVEHSLPTGDAVAFDTKGFAGKFGAPGTSLDIGADGTYRLSVHAESANAELSTDGTWTVETDGKHILLDPSSKAEADRLYEIISQDELRAVDGGQSLSREGSGK